MSSSSSQTYQSNTPPPRPYSPKYKWRTSISLSEATSPTREHPAPRFNDVKLTDSFDTQKVYTYGARRASGQATTHEESVSAVVKFQRERHACRAGCYDCSSCMSRTPSYRE